MNIIPDARTDCRNIAPVKFHLHINGDISSRLLGFIAYKGVGALGLSPFIVPLHL
jgi:hypothetical protein